jgi:hypothetical protein
MYAVPIRFTVGESFLPFWLFCYSGSELRPNSRQEDSREPVKKVRGQRRCRRCGETSYNARTCAVEIVDASDSNESK